MSRFRRPLLAVIAVLTGVAGAVAASAPSQAAPSHAARSAAAPASAGPLVALPASTAPRAPAGTVRLGLVAPATRLKVDVTLKLPDQSKVNAYLAGLANKKSPLYRQFLRPGQFGPMFGPSLSQVATVENALRSAGLAPGAVTQNRLLIPVTASAAAIDHAFGIELVRYRLPDGRVAYANSAAPRLPATAAKLVDGIIGLDNLYLRTNHIARPSGPVAPLPRPQGQRPMRAAPDTAGPQPCSAASNLNSLGALTANQFAAHYLMSPLYSAGDFGQGVRVALIEFEPNLSSDIATYESCYGISTSVTDVHVDGGAGTGAGSGEAALDIEDVAGLAPKAAIDVYQAPNSSTGSLDDYTALVNADKDAVVSTSWGLCEPYEGSANITSLQTVLEQANMQGQTVFAAAGDSGSTACFFSGGPDASALTVQDPSSQPFVVGVGGTSIGTSTESVWNDSSTDEGAGSGGISGFWCMPTYQYQTAIPGLINAHSATNSSCPTAVTHHIRQVPDVSADGDPNTGYAVVVSGVWEPIGGTSAAAPLWAAIAALTDASPFCSAWGSGRAGVFPEALYGVVAAVPGYIYTDGEVLFDVTSGNNDYTPSGYTGGLYPAGKGYDEATGLGVPLVTGFNGSGNLSMFFPGVTGVMCAAFAQSKLSTVKVTGVSPKAGPAGHAKTVTVHGTNFLAVVGADMAAINGTTLVPAKCATRTACTVTVPAKAAGTTINIQIVAEDFFASAITAADRYQYVAAPGLTSLSPARGPARGGNRVTIHGARFIGVSAVRFGTKLATGLKVVSATEVTAIAPAGAGTVHVTVTAAGGTTSSTSAASRYQYIAAPGVTSLNPAKGSHKGGTKVTIHGTNFIGVTAVRFGGKLATSIKIVSATEIIVVSPAGTGTVHVTVTAVGGTSSSTNSGSRYRYT